MSAANPKPKHHEESMAQDKTLLRRDALDYALRSGFTKSAAENVEAAEIYLAFLEGQKPEPASAAVPGNSAE